MYEKAGRLRHDDAPRSVRGMGKGKEGGKKNCIPDPRASCLELLISNSDLQNGGQNGGVRYRAAARDLPASVVVVAGAPQEKS